MDEKALSQLYQRGAKAATRLSPEAVGRLAINPSAHDVSQLSASDIEALRLTDALQPWHEAVSASIGTAARPTLLERLRSLVATQRVLAPALGASAAAVALAVALGTMSQEPHSSLSTNNGAKVAMDAEIFSASFEGLSAEQPLFGTGFEKA